MKKIFLNVFARIWAFWGLVSFIITFLIIFIPSMIAYLLPDPGGQHYFIIVSRIWMRIWLPLIGCPVRVYGKNQFAKGQPYIVLFNHNAFLDVPLSAPFVPGANKTIAKASFAKFPLFGWFYSKGSVLVDRRSEKSRSRSFEAMKKVLAGGMHMCIYPEGTRNRTTEPLKEFYDGAFKLAVATGNPIIPCVITGTKKAMPINRSFYLLPVKLKMHFLPPVPSTGISVTDLKDKVFVLMRDFYVSQVGADHDQRS
ncbi:MAG: 1-acyl-sn-glycerol-3-phosphate acyltransferase [Chitinophagaceae bacterium]|nr:1-acyl-sn-glycerol-3-phosphate acyltransferase [Chitinophagaceae bacterium]MBL0056661.1 1-acyl-sn-glycerol-3-phosphate acyltransferase [Chitinophagaceae bacterium]